MEKLKSAAAEAEQDMVLSTKEAATEQASAEDTKKVTTEVVLETATDEATAKAVAFEGSDTVDELSKKADIAAEAVEDARVAYQHAMSEFDVKRAQMVSISHLPHSAD